MQELDLRIFDKYLFASRWGVGNKGEEEMAGCGGGEKCM